jgi:hypothetical protein
MICEYALDPALVARWHDPKEWAFVREAFGSESGRFGSRVSTKTKWQRAVRKELRRARLSATEDSVDGRRLDALLEKLSERMIERECNHPECPTWLSKAVAEHRARPFHGILSTIPDVSIPAVMTPDMLLDEHPPAAWRVPPNPAPPRTAEAFATALAPLLTRSREVVFVDPWFDPKKRRFRATLKAMLDVLWGPDCCVRTPLAQLVFAESGRSPAWLMSECERLLPPIVPAGHALAVTILKEREVGEKIHNRYVLTCLAGAAFGIGRDEADDDAGEFQSDDLCRLSSEQLVKRWGQYVSARGSWFDIAAGPAAISSSN